jgi:uncharacterized protein GlcG (DUF336 family)
MGKSFAKQSISEELAFQMIQAAEAKAKEIGMGICTTVVDESGVMKAFGRMDGAPLIAVDVSRQKAVTAVGFGMPTGKPWYDFVKDDPILSAGVHDINDFTLLGGGSPIQIEGAIVGAVGVSGGHYEQDEACTNAALALLGD